MLRDVGQVGDDGGVALRELGGDKRPLPGLLVIAVEVERVQRFRAGGCGDAQGDAAGRFALICDGINRAEQGQRRGQVLAGGRNPPLLSRAAGEGWRLQRAERHAEAFARLGRVDGQRQAVGMADARRLGIEGHVLRAGQSIQQREGRQQQGDRHQNKHDETEQQRGQQAAATLLLRRPALGRGHRGHAARRGDRLVSLPGGLDGGRRGGRPGRFLAGGLGLRLVLRLRLVVVHHECHRIILHLESRRNGRCSPAQSTPLAGRQGRAARNRAGRPHGCTWSGGDIYPYPGKLSTSSPRPLWLMEGTPGMAPFGYA